MRRTLARPVRGTTALIIATLVMWTLAPAVAADDGLEVTTPFPAVAVAPGTKVSFDLTVTSFTQTATVALELGGVPDGWTASLLGGGFVVDGVSVDSRARTARSASMWTCRRRRRPAPRRSA